MAEHTQVLKATAKTYIRGAADATIRKRLFLALMERYGTLLYNQDGYDINWNVMNSEPELQTFSDSDVITYQNHNAYTQASLDWRGYKLTDLISLKQTLMNRGEAQIVNLMDQKLKNLVETARKKLNGELYVDGNATGNGSRFHGINSFTGAGSCAATDLVAKCNDSYAGLSTVQAAVGGVWTTDLGSGNYPNATLASDWPDGSGDPEYDYWSPKLVNWSSSAWPSGDVTWLANCIDVLRAIGIWCHCTVGDENSPMWHMMSAKLFREFKQAYDPALRVSVPHKESQDLGFGDTLNFEGMGLKYEVDCPANEVYSITPAAMEARFLTDSLFTSGESPFFDVDQQQYKFLVYSFGNMRFNPRYFAKSKNYA